jgi:hemerythrin-like domain-containing protein
MKLTNNKTIAKVMRKHHYQLEGLLNRIKKGGQNQNDLNMLFNRFKWELEKHFFLEEKAIFFFIDTDDPETNQTKKSLMKEHDVILKRLQLLEEDLVKSNLEEIAKFQEILTKHRDMEDEVFYPSLDEALTELNKKLIMDRISNPV